MKTDYAAGHDHRETTAAMSQTQENTLVRERVYAVVNAIPAGHVTTYGSIAECLGASARQVGRILATISKEEALRLPWHRVVAEPGRVSIPDGKSRREQIRRLRKEGVRVNAKGKVQDLEAVFHVPQWSARRSGRSAKTRARPRSGS